MANPVMRDVLGKLRRFQTFSKEQGFPKVNLQELAPPQGSLDIRELDRRQQAAFSEMLAAQTAAAAAAGCEADEEAAKAAADAASAESRRARAEAAAAAQEEPAQQQGRIDPTQRPETFWQGVQVHG